MSHPVPRFEIRRRRFGRRQFRVVLIGGNGEPLTVSEHLESKHACRVNIAAQITAVGHAPVVDVSA